MSLKVQERIMMSVGFAWAFAWILYFWFAA